CAARERGAHSAGIGVRGRRAGREARRSVRQRGRAWPARRPCFHVPGGRRSDRRTGVPRDREADARSLLPVRSGRRSPIGGAAAGGRRLCRGRDAGARRPLRSPRPRRDQASSADETVMATVVFGVLVLALVLYALNAFTKVNPHTAAAVLKAGGGLSALAVAGLLGARGRLDIAIPLGLT